MKLQFDIPSVVRSLDEPVVEGGDLTLESVLLIEGTLTGQEEWERSEDARRKLMKIRKVCEPREWRLLWGYFVEGRTFEELGQAETPRICRERVRQVIAEVRRRLGIKGKKNNSLLRGIAG